MEDLQKKKQDQSNVYGHNHYPLLPLRDIVAFPHMIIPLFAGRDKSIKALDQVSETSSQIILATQKDALVDNPNQNEIYEIGTLASVLQVLKLPDGTVKILIEGLSRVRLKKVIDNGDYIETIVEHLSETAGGEKEINILVKSLLEQFEIYVNLNKRIPPEIMVSINQIEDYSRLIDAMAAHLLIKIPEKQSILSETDVKTRIELLLNILDDEINLLRVEKKIRRRVKKQMEKSQRDYYLNEQMKAIQKELGEDDGDNEIQEIEKKIKAAGLSKDAMEKANAELKKLKHMNTMSSEATVIRNYLDWLITIPWKKKSKLSNSLKDAQKILDEDHYGLEKVKDRIIEYLAVQQKIKQVKGQILCLVGPPGVGKTSLGKSIARATGRNFVRASLGGMHDESEIRGHRRTYIGSMPGKIIQSLKKAKTINPLFLLDEIDKIGADWRGDPSSALLEVLDPAQNPTFNDNYLEVDYDLSQIMFITTANTLNMPKPLLDRMEIIRISGYTEDEKIEISKRHIIRRQMKETGLKTTEWTITDDAIRDVIRYYTRESGVRNLEREIASLMRKAVKELLLNDIKKVSVTEKNLNKYLGIRKYSYGIAEDENQIGAVTGLAWTEVGGEILSIESVMMEGKGKVTLTGQLGDVMKESVEAARSYIRANSDTFNIEHDIFEKNDLHVHVPEGATPKDGPSAGVAMCVSMVSTLTKNPIKKDVAMTGEITLRGKVLAIGGLKEKLLAALRGGLKTVIIPKENEKDLAEIPKNVIEALKIIPIDDAEEALKIALVKPFSKKSASNNNKTKK